MRIIRYRWEAGAKVFDLDMVPVAGTKGQPFSFGEADKKRAMEVGGFWMGVVPVTQALWDHVMGSEGRPALHRGDDLPRENVSWDEIHHSDGFLNRINQSNIRTELVNRACEHLASIKGESLAHARLRLPSEVEWEYAARGGPHWQDGFRFSGSNDIEAVGWYGRKHGDHTQPVAQKAPNQLGIHDMCGNVWEWCQDVYTTDVSLIPTDGSPFLGAGEDRVLRGGCFHNGAVHCTVSKRYEIGSQFHDGCIGFRLALASH